eukprot:365455-Chlamydomonas_euryale.AAC.15
MRPGNKAGPAAQARSRGTVSTIKLPIEQVAPYFATSCPMPERRVVNVSVSRAVAGELQDPTQVLGKDGPVWGRLAWTWL